MREGIPLIGNLQLLRGIAAMTVAVGHAGLWLGDVQPVSTFFVISGFIMCFITEKDASGFLPRRIIRIAPFYWVCTALYLLVVYRWAFLRPWGWHSEFTSKLARSLMFMPFASDDLPALGVGWTLNLEMYFYALFALSLAISRRLAPIMTACAIVAVMLIHSAGCNLLVCEAYSHGYIRYFLAGIALFYVWRPIGHALPRWLAAAGGSAGLVACYAGVMPTDPDLFPIMVVAFALFMSAAGVDVQWWPALLVGEASYAIYLIHPTVIELTHRHGIESLPIVAALCLAIGIAAHLAVEKPLHRWALARYRSYQHVPVRLPAE